MRMERQNAWLYDENLSLSDRGLLAALLDTIIADAPGFSADLLAKRLGVGPYTVRRSLRTLENHGYLVRRQDREAGRMAAMSYTIHARPVPKPVPDEE